MKIHIDFRGDYNIRTRIKNAFGFKDRRLPKRYEYVFIKLEKTRKTIGTTGASDCNHMGYIHYIYDKKTNTLIPKNIYKGT